MRRSPRLAAIAVLALVLLAGAAAPTIGQIISYALIDATGETDLRQQLEGLFLQLVPLKREYVNTADLTPIDHADVSPYGANTFFQWQGDRARLAASFQLLEQAGVRWIRQQMPWSDIEIPAKGQYVDAFGRSTWDKYDALVDLAAQHGINIVARLDFPPDWARQDNSNSFAPPDNLDDYGDFVYTFVSRYRGRIRYYQIWNEPNTAAEWAPRLVDPAAYVQLLRVGYERAKAADPEAVIVAAALAPTLGSLDGRNRNDLEYLQGMYNSGAAPYFDIMSAMAYGLWSGPGDRRLEANRTNFSRPRLIRDIMVVNGDGAKPIWAAETGWNALPANWPQTATHGRVSEELQARYAVQAYRRAQDEWPWLGVIFYWHFGIPFDENRDQQNFYFRMVDPNLTPHPVYWAYQGLATAPAVVPFGHHQESYYALAYQGEWQSVRDQAAVLGAYRQSAQAGDRLTFTFRGTGFDLVTRRGPPMGRALLTVDGQAQAANRLPRDEGERAYLDLQAAQVSPPVQVPVASGLWYGEHTVVVEVASGGGAVAVDGVVVYAGQGHLIRAALAALLVGAVLAAAVLAARVERPIR